MRRGCVFLLPNDDGLALLHSVEVDLLDPGAPLILCSASLPLWARIKTLVLKADRLAWRHGGVQPCDKHPGPKHVNVDSSCHTALIRVSTHSAYKGLVKEGSSLGLGGRLPKP